MAILDLPISQQALQKQRGPKEGIGLCLSGGGYRAMLFHTGAFWRLSEMGLLARLDRISSVSGGSIVSAKVALEWERLQSLADYVQHVVKPIRRLARWWIDYPCIVLGETFPGGVAKFVSLTYRLFLFGNKRLRDLPTAPEFIINATNVETGSLWRFSREFMADWQVGTIERPELALADAVAASSAFPPFLSPFVLRVRPEDFKPDKKKIKAEMRSNILLTDGGVYDNLGMETVWKSYRNVLVSDAGAAVAPQADPHSDWFRHAKRVMGINYNQVASLRKRQLIASYRLPSDNKARRRGAYWGIGSDVANYHFPDSLEADFDETTRLARLGTQLHPFSRADDERLINWGYAICDTAIRRHFSKFGPYPPPEFPYPGGV
jgi:NTE family protein